MLILPQALTFRILTGKQHKSHIQKFGTIKKKLIQKQQKQKPVHLVNNDGNYGTLTSMGEKSSHCKFQITATMQNTAPDQKKHNRKYMVKSSHQECVVTKPKKERNSEQLSFYLMVSTQSFIIPEVKTTIILSGDKFIVIYHPSANIAPYSAQATRSYLFW